MEAAKAPTQRQPPFIGKMGSGSINTCGTVWGELQKYPFDSGEDFPNLLADPVQLQLHFCLSVQHLAAADSGVTGLAHLRHSGLKREPDPLKRKISKEEDKQSTQQPVLAMLRIAFEVACLPA